MLIINFPNRTVTGEVKEEQQLPIYQSAREEKIYNSQKVFAEQTGADSESLVNIFKELIASAIRIEKNMEHYRLEVKEADVKAIKQELNTSNQILSDFIIYMDSVKEVLHENGIVGDKFLVSLSEYYKNLFNSNES
ncbi:MAG: chorismate mutase [Lachnospiraceae bacterium]|nr:chorismate mutase [Lachnospiraceae bacterium]